jgi:serine/threonine-protein kinase HipA
MQTDKPHLVGVITTDKGVIEFTYDDDYCADPVNPALSFALPLRTESYCGNSVETFFEGLLPEENARVALARKLGVDNRSYLKILQALGQECVGDVVISPSEEPLMPNPHYQPLSREVLERLSIGFADAAVELLEVSRLSIAGAQYKVGLYHSPMSSHSGTEWFIPTGTAPSSHIVKLPNSSFEDLAFNEYLCMRAAYYCGIPTPELFLFGGESPLLAIKRFDRMVDADSRSTDSMLSLRRLHQQDMCQALGIPTSKKYEERQLGYLKKMGELIAAVSADPYEDARGLARLMLFNYLIGNCDNHLKNYSLVMDSPGGEVRLSPAYDIVATTIYPHLSQTMGVFIGGKGRIDRIGDNIIENLARDIAVSQKAVVEIAYSLTEGFKGALDKSYAELSGMGYPQGDVVYKRILADSRTRLKVLRAK